MPGSDSNSVGIEFTIYAKNKGTGRVIDYDHFDDLCLGEGYSIDDFNTIELTKLQFSWYEYNAYQGLEDFECKPNPVTERLGEYTIRCRLKEENSISKRNTLTFDSPIVIELIYGYKSTETAEIAILSDNSELS